MGVKIPTHYVVRIKRLRFSMRAQYRRLGGEDLKAASGPIKTIVVAVVSPKSRRH